MLRRGEIDTAAETRALNAMATILVPTRVRYGFTGGVGEVIRLLGAYSEASGHRVIDLSGAPIPRQFPMRSKSPGAAVLRRLSHLKALLWYKSEIPKSDLVFFQTSLNRNALWRDMAYMRRCERLGLPFSVFFHGWDWGLADRLSASRRRSTDVARLLQGAKAIFVLARGFKEVLKSWGVSPQKIKIETTMVEDRLMDDFDIDGKIVARDRGAGLKILFMGRVVREKGIYESLEAFRLHKQRFPMSTLHFAGIGRDLGSLREKVYRDSIEGVHFRGFVDGEEKSSLLAETDVFLLPSFHGEGLPVAMLEALAFGNTIISSPLGGIGDLIRVPDMGRLEPGGNPVRYAELLDEIAKDPRSWADSARLNHGFAKAHVKASVVCGRIFREIAGDA